MLTLKEYTVKAREIIRGKNPRFARDFEAIGFVIHRMARADQTYDPFYGITQQQWRHACGVKGLTTFIRRRGKAPKTMELHEGMSFIFRRESTKEILSCLTDRNQRAMIKMHVIFDHSIRYVAKEFGISRRAAKKVIFDGLNKLRYYYT